MLNAIRRLPLLFWACLLVLCYWFYVKVFHLHALNYTSDMFHMLQISRTWHEKGQLFLENAYGGQGPVHSYFLIFLFSPLTFFFGVKGFFIGWLALLALLLAFVSSSSQLRGERALVVGFFLLGPQAFWLFDDPVFGFQLELLFAPLALLFSLALARGKRMEIFLSALALGLVREEGPLLVASVYLGHIFFQGIFLKNAIPWKALAQRLALCATWFVLNLAWLKWMAHLNPNHPAQTSNRVVEGFLNLIQSAQDPYYFGLYLRMLRYLVALPLMTFVLLFPIRDALKLFGLWLLVSLPFIVINYISSGTYFPMIYEFGLTWPYRAAPCIGLFWSLLASGLSHLNLRWSRPRWTFLALALLFVAQAHLLYKDRSYRVWEHFFPFAYTKSWQRNKVSEEELRVARCFAYSLPQRFPISSSPHLFALFEDADLVWPDRVKFSAVRPKAFLCHHGLDRSETSACFKTEGLPPETLAHLIFGKLELFYSQDPNYEVQLLESAWSKCQP